jgi:hypothetical protein
MSGSSARKLTGAGAFAVVVLWLVGFFLAGKPPKFAGTPASVVKYYADHHKQVLIAVILVAIGIAIYLAVFAQLAMHLRNAGQPALGAVVLVGAAASAGLFSVGDAIYGVIAQAVQQPGADPGLAKALYMLDQFAGIPMYWLSLLAILSVTIAAARGVFPGWAVWLTGLFAVLVALGGICVKASGAFAAGTGPIANLAFGAALVFLLEVGILLWGAKEPGAQTTA